jgi:hypothetical protein
MRKIATVLMLMLTAAWFLGGCSSDSTAPNDDLPPLSNEDIAGQAGFLAVALVQIAPLSVDYDGAKSPAQGEYTYTFAPGDPVQGTVNLEFRDGGPSGDLAHYADADWSRAYTSSGAPLSVEVIEGAVPWVLSFNLTSDIDRQNDTATVNGSGLLIVGSYLATWSLDALVVYSGETTTWPGSGTMTFTADGRTATVTFDGDHTATIEIDGETYILDLENGALTPVGDSR